MTPLRESPTPWPSHHTAKVWGASGILLLALIGAVAWIAKDFTYGTDMTSRPILLLVALLVAAGVVYLGAIWSIGRTVPVPGLVGWIFVAGAGMRLILSLSQPILEDDWYRYLWDGAVTAHGINPYVHAPAAVEADPGASGLDRLAGEAGIILERVNHPELGTIYPPVAQAAFALAHWIAPWRIGGLRVLYFAIDCAVFALLIALLRHLGRSPLHTAVYWWNPLIVKEFYNSVHMDLLALPWILGALLLLFQRRVVLSAAALAVAVAVKLWPVLLVPPLLAAARRTPRKAAAAAAVFVVVAGILLAPMAATVSLGDDSGLAAYGKRWEMNDALFMVFPWLAGHVSGLAGVDLSAAQAHRAGRVMAALIVTGMSLYAGWAVWRHRETPHADSCSAALSCRLAALWCAVAATLFLVSPTQFPWYYLWVLPLLALAPRASLLALTVMLPLYYLKFYFAARGEADFFHYRVVWIEYAPVWALLLWEGWKALRRPYSV